jgi:hypothetical protein
MQCIPCKEDYQDLEDDIVGIHSLKWLFEHEMNRAPKEQVKEIPICCEKCANHPMNGGSNTCFCTLPKDLNIVPWGSYFYDWYR